ncbi:hypothetical protein [Numidum massiliense]|uniref:hypothetical protein n=1 Tax=Numidum massiliense TaxID=1522315 RepID=UPI0006D5356A|nr:hypothetical protein [Numidum massiliense]
MNGRGLLWTTLISTAAAVIMRRMNKRRRKMTQRNWLQRLTQAIIPPMQNIRPFRKMMRRMAR